MCQTKSVSECTALLLQLCDNETVSEPWDVQPCNELGDPFKFVISCSKLVDNLGQQVLTQLAISFPTDLLQVMGFFCAYKASCSRITLGKFFQSLETAASIFSILVVYNLDGCVVCD